MAADASSPFEVAIDAAAVSPAISAAMVLGEKPPSSSQRSCGVDGPWPTRKSAAVFTCSA
jgi:hypothetical protein